MNLILGWILGFLAGEVMQLGAWKLGHADKPWKEYVTGEAPAHWLFNLGLVAICGVAWSVNLLGPTLEKVGLATPIAELLTISPPFGFILAGLIDLVGDKYAYGFLKRFSPKEEKE